MTGLKYLLFGSLLLAGSVRAADFTYVSTPYIGLRYRNSTLLQDNISNTGHANTLRLQMGYLWALTPHLAAYAEGTTVASLFGKQYYDTSGRRTPYPTEPDPRSTEVSSAWIGYDNGKVGVKVGEQYLNFYNNRYFATSAWRQNPQSFDGITTFAAFDTGTTVSYDWINRVNRTVGANFADINQRRYVLDAQLIRIDQAVPLGTVTAYGYFVKNKTLDTASTRTLGGRWIGRLPLLDDRTALSWTFEGAQQTNYGNNPAHFSLPYHLFELDYGLPYFSARAGQESLGGNGHTAYNVAYGSNHSFDGWVGVFSIPSHGLVDTYGGLFGETGWHALSWQVIYHNFVPATGSGRRYGDEIDAGLHANVTKRFTLELQYGSYNAASFSVTQRKLWLLAEYKYGKQSM